MAKIKDLVGYHSHDSLTVILTVDNISISLLFHHIEVLYSSIFSKILFELIPVNPFSAEASRSWISGWEYKCSIELVWESFREHG